MNQISARLETLKEDAALRENFAGRKVRIFSGEHNAWWRPNAAGYTTHQEAAGEYSFEEAWRYVRSLDPSKMIHIETVPPRTGAQMIAAERRRQVESEGWAAWHDDAHTGGELAMAAASYALLTSAGPAPEPNCHARIRAANDAWPWDIEQFKPKDDISNLVRAGALIAAEIDRIQRKQGGAQ